MIAANVIETTANEVYGMNVTNNIQTAPNEVYGVTVTDDIDTTPNEVYGVTITDDISTTPNEVYGLRNLSVCPQRVHVECEIRTSITPAVYEDIGNIQQ